MVIMDIVGMMIESAIAIMEKGGIIMEAAMVIMDVLRLIDIGINRPLSHLTERVKHLRYIWLYDICLSMHDW